MADRIEIGNQTIELEIQDSDQRHVGYFAKCNAAGGFKGKDRYHVADWLSKEFHHWHHRDPAIEIDRERGWFQLYQSSIVIEVKQRSVGVFDCRFVGRVVRNGAAA